MTKTLKPIFHWKLGLHWLPNANEINPKNMKCTWPMENFAFGTQRNLYSIDLHLGFTLGATNFTFGIECFGDFRYQHVGIGNAKSSHRVCNPRQGPDASGFASQWNIGLKMLRSLLFIFKTKESGHHRVTKHVQHDVKFWGTTY